MLPDDFLQRFHALCPEPLRAVALASFGAPKRVSFRLNRLRPDPHAALQALRDLGLLPQPVAWARAAGIEAYEIPPEQRELLTHSRPADQGDIYVQSLSSMLAPLLLAPQPDDWVLDLAAAPGGKTILLAELMGNSGKISAVEPVQGRFHKLKANLARCGVTNTQTYLKDGRAVGSLKPEAFDRVLLDAPCSSESRFRTDDPASTSHWSLRKVDECARKQTRLILSAYDALKPGGRLMYCTCSYAPEENEAVVHHLLRKRPGAQVLDTVVPLEHASPGITHWAGKELDPACARTARIWPTDGMDGFFLALIAKPEV